jgi:tetratricopeptide (TPR) repeat protein
MSGKQTIKSVVTWLVEILKKITRKRTSKKLHHSNQVTQNNNVVSGDIVGGNKQIVINIFALGALDSEERIEFIKANFGFDTKFIRNFLESKEVGNRYIHSIDQDLLLLQIFSNSNLQGSYEKIKSVYANIELKDNMPLDEKVQYNIDSASTYVKKLEFEKAHQILADSLEIISPSHNRYNFIYKEYLITGFICYTRKNDINGLKSLLYHKSKIGNAEDSNTDYIISIIFQEIFSRDTDVNALGEVVLRLTDIYNNANNSIKPAMSNSLGLAYRRLGERTGIADLNKAITFFEEGLKLNGENKKIEIELKDQMSITHIRIFECNHDIQQLTIAETLLKDCLELLEGPMDPEDYRLKPRVLNNIGNIYKQRILIFKDVTSAPKAIVYYEDAEQYWNEKDASYDWALVRKNIAETKYALGKITRDPKILLESLEDCISAIRYRNLENSPYQWGKTVKIVLSIIILLKDLNELKLVSKSAREKILSYVISIMEDEETWSENISSELIQSARQVKTFLA